MAWTMKLTQRGKASLRKFEALGRKGKEALKDGLEMSAIKGATFTFRSFRDRRQYGQGGSAWALNQGWWATFKEKVLGQSPAIPGQGATGVLKRSVQFAIRSPKVVQFTPGGAQTTFGTNSPYAHRFAMGGGVQDFWVERGGSIFRFSQACVGRPFLVTNETMRPEFKRQMEIAYNKVIRKTVGT